MDTETLSTEELLSLHFIRVGKEPSKALPSIKYQNPANHAKAKGIRMHLKAADSLLWKWWVYTRRRDNGIGEGVAHYYRDIKPSRQWDRENDITDSYEHAATLRKIDRDIIPTLKPTQCAAICVEMRNREGARVWRTDGNYGEALADVDIKLRDAGLL